jgi:hypothetical protein
VNVPPHHSVEKPKRRARFLWLKIFVVVLALLVGGIAAALHFKGYQILKSYVQSPAGQNAASHGLSHAIKVDGTFAPLRLEGWTVETASYGGPGWPGEALGGIKAETIRAEFDPAAIFHRAWRISGIQIDRATVDLRPPNDALKRPVAPKKPRPWYAFLLPDHFECGPIVAQNTVLDFSFQNQSARIHDAHVQADLIGKDLKYTATSGVLEFPYLPPLQIHRLEMLVTRPLITIYTAQLVAIDPGDPARITLSGKLGMRENKSIDANLEIVQVPIEQILPTDLQSLVHGRATGKLIWTRDATGKQIFSDGDLTISDGRIDDLSVFRQLALLHDNPDLKDFSFDQATCHFHLQDGVCTLDLRAHAPGKFTVAGKIDYVLASKVASLKVSFNDLPLQTWLPPDFKPHSSGNASAALQWQGRLDTVKDSSGAVAINLDGAKLNMPAVLKKALAPRGVQTPDDIQFQKADLNIAYQGQVFTLTRGDLALPGILNAQLSGTLSAESLLQATVDWQGLTIQDWLPAALADQFSGDINGHATAQVSRWKMGEGVYGGNVTLLHGELRFTSAQSMLARFTNNRGLLDIPLTRARFSWVLDHENLTVTDIDLRGRDDVGVQGTLHMNSKKELSGYLWIGTKPVYLKSLAEAGAAVFSRHQDGLVWAKVNISGTTQKPRQDLSEQVIHQLKSRPLVVLGLGVKLTSWYLGNLFGAADEWKRPE